MRQFTVYAAKTNLSRLIKAALAGEHGVIPRGEPPVVPLAAMLQRRFKLGMLSHGLNGPAPDFRTPMADEELAQWEG